MLFRISLFFLVLLFSCTLKKEEPTLPSNYRILCELQKNELPYRALFFDDTSYTIAVLKPETLLISRFFIDGVRRQDFLQMSFNYEKPLNDVSGYGNVILISKGDTLYEYNLTGDELLLTGKHYMSKIYKSLFLVSTNTFIALAEDSFIYRVTLPGLDEERLFDFENIDAKIEVKDTLLLTTAGYLYTLSDSLILNVSNAGYSFAFYEDALLGYSRNYIPYFVKVSIPGGNFDYMGAFGAPYIALPMVFDERILYVGFDEEPKPLRRGALPTIFLNEESFPTHYLIEYLGETR